MNDLLVAADLVVEYETDHGPQRALDSATLTVAPGEFVGLVGESGSGKSTLGLAIGRLLPPNGHLRGGDLLLDSQAVFGLPPEAMRRQRRETLAFIFQDPIGSLDPTMRIGRQVGLAVADAGDTRSVDTHLERVGLRDTDRIAASFPHELSGGMAQRVAIAIALARRPRLIVADEPTAQLDATIRRQLLDLLFGLAADARAAVLFLTHDLRSVEKYCSRVAVMYAGRTVENGATGRIFRYPVHPYTRALLASAVGHEGIGGMIVPIAGMPPTLRGPATGCAFAPRCTWAVARCRTERPVPEVIDGRLVLCHRAAESYAASLAKSEVPANA
jgi:oligopeptide/dipeptide ABC transporter ATP-binding protein